MNFWRLVNRIIEEADIVLEVLDARLVQESRNPEIEKKVTDRGKVLIYVVNKTDLIRQSDLKGKLTELYPMCLVSSKKKLGSTKLKRLILRYAKGDVTVGVLGYPNTGKSSVINMLKGRNAARTSPVSGHTRGLQKIRTGSITLIDTPGVIPFLEKDSLKHALLGTKSVDQLKDPEAVALDMIPVLKKQLEEHYGIILPDDPEDALEEIAVKLNLMMKGGVPDTIRASKRLIDDWQRGKVR